MINVLVIAGTADARQIIERLTKLNINVAATVTTQFGSELLAGTEGVQVYEGKLDAQGMAELIVRTGARCLVDASHPFAREASQNAIAACKLARTAYLRFERKGTEFDGPGVLKVKSMVDAAVLADRIEGNILLTTGSNTLETFTKEVSNFKERLYARVLPDSKVLMKCEQLGLTAKNILAVKGPFSEEMNIAMLKYCNAKTVVTKDSGDTGGTGEKLSAAEKLGVKVILVERPDIDYTYKVSSVEEVLEFVKKYGGV